MDVSVDAGAGEHVDESRHARPLGCHLPGHPL